MGKDLIVCSVPTDNETKNNKVYVAPTDYAAYSGSSGIVMINGYPFAIAMNGLVPPGSIAMNVIQRRMLNLSTTAGSTVAPIPLSFTPPDMAQVNLKVEHVMANKKGGTLDCRDFSEYVRVQFCEQCFRTNQQFAIVMDNGLRLTATVETMQIVGGGKGDTAYLTPSTNIHVAVAERSEISLVNVSDTQLDAQQTPIMRDFDLEKMGIGGLREQFGKVFRRAFASRVYPVSVIKKIGIKHVKGVVLYGPPGTGKTLIARKIGEMLNCHEPKIVNGPEILNKFVGGTEENVRNLFADAEAEQTAKGDQSQLHLIIFDEFDAICKQRGVIRDSTGVNDNVVNQLLSKIDGVTSLNNILLIGLTNRLDLIDEAVLRPGRFEVHIEIGLPDEPGRLEIFRIHTKGMRENRMVDSAVSLEKLAEETKNYSGAEIEGVVRAAVSNAFVRHISMDNPGAQVDTTDLIVTVQDFEAAVQEVKPAFGGGEEECKKLNPGELIEYPPQWDVVRKNLLVGVKLPEENSNINMVSKLLYGKAGTGKSALTAYIAEQTQYPFVKVVSSKDMIGFSEMQKSNVIRKVFEDAYKSPKSCIILDDLERLIEYSELGGRYSNAVLQALLVLIKAPPPAGKKLLVLATTGQYEVIEALELGACFTLKQEVMPIRPSYQIIDTILTTLGIEWVDKGAYEVNPEPYFPSMIAIKPLILCLEMAAKSVAGNPKKQFSLVTVPDALRSLGIPMPVPKHELLA